MMPGAACLEIYVRVYELYQQGRHAQAKELFERLVPYLAFALQHLEVAIQIEKRVLHKRGILPNSRLRAPTISLGATYTAQLESLVDSVIAVSQQCREQPAGAKSYDQRVFFQL